jgi:outer membrane protein
MLDDNASTITNAQIQTSYTLFDGFGNIYEYQRLRMSGDLGELRARRQIENTLYAVSSAYYAAALAFDNWNITKELTGISKERLERAKVKLVFGQANTIQVLAAQVDLNSDSVTTTQAEFSWNRSLRNLNLLLNEDIGKEYNVDSEIDFLQEKELSKWHSIAQNQNATYLIAANELDRSELNFKIARSASFPKINLQGSYGLNQTATDFHIGLDDPDRTWRVGATFNFNLFNGFQTRIRRQNAKIDFESQKVLHSEARLELEKNITDAFESYQNSRFVLSLEEKNLEPAELNFKRTEELFNLGRVTNTQFREAQLNLIRAKNGIVTAKFKAKLDELELLRLTGMLLGINSN